MLGSIRKFSSSIYAKIFLVIVAIPFIFWGMGPVFQAGKTNTVVVIGDEKISTNEFVEFVRLRLSNEEQVNEDLINKLFSNFIGEKLIQFEIKEMGIIISDDSLSKIIKNEPIFKKNNAFSRTEYEKFLVKNSIDAITFENNLLNQGKKDQFFGFLSGGIVPSKFMVNNFYNKINQERNIQLINLNNVFKNNFNFSSEEYKSYYEENKSNYNTVYKTIKFIELTPNNLNGTDEYNNVFFEKIDEIDDLIVEGNKIDFILKKFNLPTSKNISLDKLGLDMNGNKITNFSDKLIPNLFKIGDDEKTSLIEDADKYYVIELSKTDSVQRDFNNNFVQKDILTNLKKDKTRNLISEIISKINNNNFNKNDFDSYSKNENAKVEIIKIKNQNDDKVIKKELIKQIYSYPEKKVIVVADIGFVENYLIYIDKIDLVTIDENSKDYEKYFKLAKTNITNRLYNSYDTYLDKKYKIDINYNALDSIKNSLK